MNKRNNIILRKVIEETQMIEKLISGIDEAGFLGSEEKMRAVCMTLINIGELVKNLSDESRLKYQHIEWKDIAGFRDITAHGYFTLRMQDVRIYASEELPVISGKISSIVEDDTEENEDGDTDP